MTNSISIYNFNQNQVRTQNIDGSPWFCLADVCAALKIANSRTSVKLAEAGVGKTYISHPTGKKEITFINEPNLYRLIFRSNKPQAQAFADWVCGEVLPSIRKTGGYVAQSAQLPSEAMKALGGMVKRCAAAGIREEINDLRDADMVKLVAVLLDNIINQRMAIKLEAIKKLICQK